MAKQKKIEVDNNVAVGDGFIRVGKATWPEFKEYIDGTKKRLQHQHSEDSDRYTVFALDEKIFYFCHLVKDPTQYTQTYDTPEKIATHNGYLADFETNWKNKSNKPVKPVTAANAPVVSTRPAEGSRLTLVTPNWCDKTTWYPASMREVNQLATCDNPGTYTVYSVPHQNLIDTYHGKIFQENFLKDAANNSYRIIVTVNGVTKTEQDPYGSPAGDYTIDYALGKITFSSALTVNDEVRATYHRATSSLYVIKPAAGKVLKIKAVEVQFSKNIVLTDTVTFQPYVNHPQAGLIPVGDAMVYKTFRDYINEANGMLPEIPALGGNGWRGLQQPVLTFPWLYQTVTTLSSSDYLEIHIQLEHNTPFTGEYATGTFYCLVEDQ